MSDRLTDSKWTWGGVLLLGVGTLAAAGGLALAIYYVRNRRVKVKEPPVLAVREPELHGLGRPPFSVLPEGGEDETDFAGTTYEELYEEIQKSIQALVDNKDLYSAFIGYTEVSSQSVERLRALLQHLKQLESALQTNRPLPKTTTADIHAVVKALSSSPADQKEELQTLIPLVTALLEFPPHIVKKARSLTAAKRQTLVNLIRSTPSGVSRHVYMDKYKKPYEDPDLHPIMTRMGFSVPSYQTKLTYTAAKEDRLYAGLYLLLGTEVPSE